MDGTGGPAVRADVRVVDGTVREIGPGISAATADDVVDLGGLVLAPGFIDPHTHYDAQVLWDPDVTPSSWHGITTVVVGNCGFGVAPARPEGREIIMRTLENVEGMPYDALEAGIPWEFETFPEYLDALDRRSLRANISVMCGHTPVRFWVMGEEATQREATADELAQMRAIMVEALRAGANGFSTTRSPGHVGAYGQPVPSRLASLEEVWTLAGALGEVGHGTVDAAWGPDLWVEQFPQLAADIGRPVSWVGHHDQGRRPLVRGRHRGPGRRPGGPGADVTYPQVACKPIVVQMALSDPFPFANVPAFAEILAQPHEGRAALYASEAWRAGGPAAGPRDLGRHARHHGGGREPRPPRPHRRPDARQAGRRTGRGHARRHGRPGPGRRPRDPLPGHHDQRRRAADRRDAATTPASCSACRTPAPTRASCATPTTPPTSSPASCASGRAGARDRRVAPHRPPGPGLRAHRPRRDRPRLGGRPRRLRPGDGRGRTGPSASHDFPGGADRLVVRSTGIEHVWVSGQAVRRAGEDLAGVRPGGLLRAGRG